MPRWGGDIAINFQDIYYYLKPAEHQGRTWDDVPEEIKKTFDRLGIPEAEKKYLAGVKAQLFESEVVYGSLQADLGEEGGVICSPTPIRRYANIPIWCVQYLRKTDHPAVGQQTGGVRIQQVSGGSFIYVPKGVKIEFPAASLLPHQRREHGPVRADADPG